MRNKFDQQLEVLHDKLTLMGALCEQAISLAIGALFQNDAGLGAEAVAREREIDQMERDIESLCLKLLLQQQPVARDLRQISSALKMITDMERIGDQAAEIAEIAISGGLCYSGYNLHIADMAEAAKKMVTESVDAFVRGDLALARDVSLRDDAVDSLFCTIRQELVELIAADTRDGAAAVDILMIAKYLERIGDHATNIAEWVEFSITGSHEGQEL